MEPPALDCPEGHGQLKRRFSFATPKIDMGGYDVSLGKHFESATERTEYLKRLSEETSKRQGFESKLVSVDRADLPATSGINDDLPTGYPSRTKTDRREEVRWL
jgi:hypothetical protein